MRSWPYYDLHEQGDSYHRPWWQWNLTRRGEIVLGIVITLLIIGAMWLAALLGWAATGVQG
jgi:hypothetical protein